MTQAATQITLSVADRVRDWSRQERNLAMALRALQPAPSPLAAPAGVLPEESLSVQVTSPRVIDAPVPWVGQPVGSLGSYEVAPAVTPAPRPVQVSVTPVPMEAFTSPEVRTFEGPSVDRFEEPGAPYNLEAPYSVEATTPAMPTVPDPRVAPIAPLAPTPPAGPAGPAGPFDEFIAAVTDPEATHLAPAGPLPPPSRFMVRVSPVGQPHRTTKRNYDYFAELNARLAAQAAARQQGGQH